ncbi:MAG: zinc ribbon domain-containing protein [Candidatus Methanomethylicaceae archaeon]
MKVLKVSEKNTSKICHKCGYTGLRVGSLFKCPNCKYTCNADYNGAMNILKRAICPRHGLPWHSQELGTMKPQVEKPTSRLYSWRVSKFFKQLYMKSM